jgi:hypothetical protein
MSKPPEVPPFPGRADVRERLEALVKGRVSREEVAAWSSPWIWARQDDCKDQAVWRALEALQGADAPTTDRPYLFGEEDFEDWLRELDSELPPA